ncbi:ACT domain-containing protein [Pseudooctadecabacter sp.]|uniref:ACT domain-containing protein n=1 Tax=Pseudooctadecabacter sp. TaxID=1966338 RepID=UPI0035C796DF
MQLSFTSLPDPYAIVRLPADAAVPEWPSGTGLTSITRAEDELSIVCRADLIPATVAAERGWSALRVETLADLDEPGVVMAAVTPISSAGLGVFVISTHLRDYLLVRSASLTQTRRLLEQAGHVVA